MDRLRGALDELDRNDFTGKILSYREVRGAKRRVMDVDPNGPVQKR